MSLVILSATETDLGNKAPYGAGFSAIAVNMTAGALTVQHSDVSGSGFVTAPNGVIGAATSTTAMQRITDLKRYIKLSGAGTVFLLPDKDL
jgi:hypothetical protein